MPTSRKLRLLSLLLILCATSGCAGALTGAKITGDYCRTALPITYDSKADTPETVTQIETHNSKWACVCGDPPDCPKAP
jgi:hypothetical protein